MVLSAENPLGITTKAIDVLTEHEHVFQYARIVTDVRPIFTNNAQEKPAAAVVVHMLNLFFNDMGQKRQLCVALDSNDLSLLKQIIERAELKEKTIKTTFAEAGLLFLESK